MRKSEEQNQMSLILKLKNVLHKQTKGDEACCAASKSYFGTFYSYRSVY